VGIVPSILGQARHPVGEEGMGQMTGLYRTGTYDPASFWEGHASEIAKWERHQPDEPEILSLVARVQAESALELGCGPGRNRGYFKGWCVGIDLAPTYLRRAKGNVVYGDVSELPFMDGMFDMVFSCSTLQHVTPDRIGMAVAEAFRVSSRYVCAIEYTEAEGDFFDQVHLFQHDYRWLFGQYGRLTWHQNIALPTQPARKELFLWVKQ